MRILWLGAMASDLALERRTAANQAAARWTRGLLGAMRASGCEIRACSHCREQVWPKGTFWPGASDDFDARYPVKFTRYPNLPAVRMAWLSAAYRRLVVAEIRAWRPDLVLLYNLEPYHCAVTGLLRHMGIPWVPIVLDHADPVRDNWRHFLQATDGASGAVFVSDWAYRHAPVTCPRLHLDGGVEHAAAPGGSPTTGVKRIVYSGKYSERYGGMGFLFAMFAAVPRADCELILTGKEVYGNLAPYLKQEPRARHLGHLSWDCLRQVYADAAVFVNPGSPDSTDNRMNFPSKLLDYLPWGKPIVSTWTAGMAEEYRELLVCPAEYSPQAYGAALSSMLDLSDEERDAVRTKLLRWCEGHAWKCQAGRLLEWLEVVSRKQ